MLRELLSIYSCKQNVYDFYSLYSKNINLFYPNYYNYRINGIYSVTH